MKKQEKDSKSKNKSSTEAPKGHCNLCWGFQEYDGDVRELFEDKQLDVNNHIKKHMRIQKFLKTYLDGTKLKKAEIHTCPECGRKIQKPE